MDALTSTGSPNRNVYQKLPSKHHTTERQKHGGAEASELPIGAIQWHGVPCGYAQHKNTRGSDPVTDRKDDTFRKVSETSERSSDLTAAQGQFFM